MRPFVRLVAVALLVTSLMGLTANHAQAQTPVSMLQETDELSEDLQYTVQSGDTLASIAEAFGVSVEAIVEANPEIDADNPVSSGDIILIPGLGGGPRIIVPVGNQPAPEGFVELIITTEPVLGGFPVTVDGEEYPTNEIGQLRLLLQEGWHNLSAPEVHQFDAETRVIFARWSDEWASSREIELKRTKQLALGLYVQHFISFEFVDGLGLPVDRAEIDSVVMMNSNGESFTFSDEGDNGSLDGVWLTRNRLRRTGGVGLLEKPNVYTFRNVFFKGLDAVQQGADEYIPSRAAAWVVPLLIFPLEVEVRNFGFNRLAEASIALHLSDGSTIDTLTANTVEGIARFAQLPPGDFELEVTAGGFSPITPIVFTGPKVEHLTVITAGLAAVGTLVGLIAGAALMMFVFRPAWRIRILTAAGSLRGSLVKRAEHRSRRDSAAVSGD